MEEELEFLVKLYYIIERKTSMWGFHVGIVMALNEVWYGITVRTIASKRLHSVEEDINVLQCKGHP